MDISQKQDWKCSDTSIQPMLDRQLRDRKWRDRSVFMNAA